MPYFVTPSDNYQFAAKQNFARSDPAARLLLFGFGIGLGCLAAVGLLALIRPDLDGTDAASPVSQYGSILILAAVMGLSQLSKLIKFVMLKRIGGDAHLGTLRLVPYARSSRSPRYSYVYAANLYLTRTEYLRLNLLPLAINYSLIIGLLVSGLPLIQAGAVIAMAIMVSMAAFPAISISTALTYPADTLFVELSDGDVMIYTTITAG